MEIRQLRYFVSAVDRGTLRAAARDHFVTQPAVSLQLKKLEQELGTRLFVRRGQRIEPTSAGRFLAEGARDVLERIDRMKRGIHRMGRLEGGLLRLGNIDAASIYVLPGVFRAFHRRYPGVDVKVLVADSDGLVTALESGAIEIAILTLPLAAAGVEVVPIYVDRMVLVVHPRHTLATPANRRRALEFVADSGLITYPAQSTTRRTIEKVFTQNGLGFRAAMEMSSPEAIKRLTEAGLGASILPAKVVAPEVRKGTLKVIPTGKITFSRTLGVVYKSISALSPPARVFLDMLIKRFEKP